MASDLGLTTWALSPSAGFSTTGRCDSPRLERGPSGGRPNPAASPASSESPGTEGMWMVRLSSCGSFMARGSVDTRTHPPGSGQRRFSRGKNKKKGKKSGKRLQEGRRLLFDLGRAAGLMERQDRQESGPELLPGQGVGVVQP